MGILSYATAIDQCVIVSKEVEMVLKSTGDYNLQAYHSFLFTAVSACVKIALIEKTVASRTCSTKSMRMDGMRVI